MVLLLALLPAAAVAQKFDPYQLNGGLVAAVAGRDYVVLASDTRLTDGGYGINSRRYLSGRMWSASSSSSLASFSSASLDGGGDGEEEAAAGSEKALGWRRYPAQFTSCGSLLMPSTSDCANQPAMATIGGTDSTILPASQPLSAHLQSTAQAGPPILIGSAGCASDCESLKRRVRLELDALECSVPNALGVQSVANLLQQVLYGRRGFPFYSFCVVAGIDRDGDHIGEGGCGAGAVYVYDAIGSYERVAVASAGTGRELMQPILDRLFSGTSPDAADEQMEGEVMQKDATAVLAQNQRKGVAGSLRPPVQTTVHCSWEEAVRNVARAYRSVAEREIAVGDEVVICVVKAAGEDGPTVDVFSYPLKKH
ncbi:hypothetical protein ACHAXT_008723 [Thalassiosira profunda]